MKIHISKKDCLYLVLFTLVFMIISQEGILKYIALSGIILVVLLKRKSLNLVYFKVLIPSLIYIMTGVLVSIIGWNFNFESVKQILIYICSGVFSIVVFSIYGKNRTAKLLDMQFVSLCLAYLILYGRYFTLTEFYYESNIFSYIFGAYALIYFCQYRMKMAALAIVFMLFDHKRIVVAAFILALFALVIIRLLKREKHQRWIKNITTVALILVPILWVYICSNNILSNLFLKYGIHSMGRLDGTGAWNIAKNYYKFSPSYIGKGIGWVLNWLGNANIFGFSNLHNDFLAAYIELGFVFFIIWIISFLSIPFIMRKKDLVLTNILNVLTGFMFVNFLTDNIYIYVTFLYPFYTILLSIMFGEDNQTYKKLYTSVISKRRSRLSETL